MIFQTTKQTMNFDFGHFDDEKWVLDCEPIKTPDGELQYIKIIILPKGEGSAAPAPAPTPAVEEAI